jgi:hypothetical protein
MDRGSHMDMDIDNMLSEVVNDPSLGEAERLFLASLRKEAARRTSAGEESVSVMVDIAERILDKSLENKK